MNPEKQPFGNDLTGDVERVTEQICEKIGYHFNNPELLLEALSPGTVEFEIRASRGDKIVGFVVSELINTQFPHFPRSNREIIGHELLSNSFLAKIAREIGLDTILAAKPSRVSSGMPQQSVGDVPLADAFEALVSAIYDDGGIDSVTDYLDQFFSRQIVEAPITEVDRWSRLKRHAEYMGYHIKLDVTQEGEKTHCTIYLNGAEYVSVESREGEGNAKRKAMNAAWKKLRDSEP